MKLSSLLVNLGQLLILFLLCAGCSAAEAGTELEFSGEQAYLYASQQIGLGPRNPGSQGHANFQNWAQEELDLLGWEVVLQEFSYQGVNLSNIIATREQSSPDSQRIVIAAHYDTRAHSDEDPDLSIRQTPVPGANDGASGVAVLLELARVMPDFDQLDVQLVFFDAEDGGGIAGWNWIMGSTYYAQNIEQIPDSVIVIDMIGDVDQAIYLEKNSDPFVAAAIWGIAEEKGISSFIFEEKYAMLDDHSPFVALGIPAVLIIDFDYPYWHTTADTLDKISPESLQNVGGVLLEWLSRMEEASGQGLP